VTMSSAVLCAKCCLSRVSGTMGAREEFHVGSRVLSRVTTSVVDSYS